jgi:hypothetical protein
MRPLIPYLASVRGREDEFLGCQHADVNDLHALLGRLGVDTCLFPKLSEDLVSKSTFEWSSKSEMSLLIHLSYATH